MLNFFGKKRRRSVKKGKKTRKPPARLIKLCKKYKIKCTKKVGKKRIYKSVTVLKKQLRRKMKSRKVRRAAFGKKKRNLFGKRRRSRFGEMEGWVNSRRDAEPWWSPWNTDEQNKKAKKKYEEHQQNLAMSAYLRKPKGSFFGKRRRGVRRTRFGNVASTAASTLPVSNYGYNNSVPKAAGVLSQSSQVVTEANNMNRPPGFGVDPSQLPIFGVYRPFFTENVPTTVGPSWNFMGQPDGSLFPVGGPFNKFTKFGKKRRGGRKSY